MNGTLLSPLPQALAVSSIETLLRQRLSLPRPLRARLTVQPKHLGEALRELSPEMRAALIYCIEVHVGRGGMPGPLTLPELREFLLGDQMDY